MQRQPAATYGKYSVYFDPPSCQRSYGRYSIFNGDKYVGATYSFPDKDACRHEELKRSGAPQTAVKNIPAHRYQPPTGKYSISIQMHRTAEKNRAARRAAMQSPVRILIESKLEGNE